MSKLYEALERLKEREEREGRERGSLSSPSPAGAAPTPKRAGLSRATWVVAALLVALVLTIYLLPAKLFFKNHSRQLERPAQKTAPSRTNPSSTAKTSHEAGTRPASPAKAIAVKLNNQGVALLREGKTWQAIYSFYRANQKDPRLPAPYYNLIASLLRAGKPGAASHFCREAIRRFGETPWFARNRRGLEAAGILPRRGAMERGGEE